MAEDELEFISVEIGDESEVALPQLEAKDPAVVKSGGVLENAMHPVACIFHLLFKGLAFALYLFAGMFDQGYVFLFVVMVLLLAFDFWTVKNVSGRLLVGLRWWNKIREDGSNEWVFECQSDMSTIGVLDSRIFWSGLYGAPAVWLVFLVSCMLKLNLEWMLVVVIALTLSGANIVGYNKCKKDAKSRMQSMLSGTALGALSDSTGLLGKITQMAMSKNNSANENITV